MFRRIRLTAVEVSQFVRCPARLATPRDVDLWSDPLLSLYVQKRCGWNIRRGAADGPPSCSKSSCEQFQSEPSAELPPPFREMTFNPPTSRDDWFRDTDHPDSNN